MKNIIGTTPSMLRQIETADNYNYYPQYQFWLACYWLTLNLIFCQIERREFTKPQKRCIRSRLNKKVKEFADNELPILFEKGLLGGKGFEPTTPATTIVNQGRFGVVTHADDNNNISYTLGMSSLGMAGVSRLQLSVKGFEYFEYHQRNVVSTSSPIVCCYVVPQDI